MRYVLFLLILGIGFLGSLSAEEGSPFLSGKSKIYKLGFEESSDELVVQTTTDWGRDPRYGENEAYLALIHKNPERRCKVFVGDFDTSELSATEVLTNSLKDVIDFLYSDKARIDQQVELTSSPPFLRTTFRFLAENQETIQVCISIYSINQWLVGFAAENDKDQELVVGDSDTMIYNTFLRQQPKL